MKEFNLNNGVIMPSVGIGTFLLEPKDAENSVREEGAWQATVHGVAKSRTQLSDFHSLTYLAASGLSRGTWA